ncbi:AAA family ATPase [Paenibacillus sp. FSL P4-0081]|uniref:AAA family ATPase n=1 Tax=Paenibacillus sp. FSL P4-0081 TaxID=1536769 RepID=UPI0009DED7B6|nr:AAA family ATPase [Paenibacillus sp. FSL P4-0081]
MQKNNLYLQFKDNNKKIEFDLNKNTVFFGNNGQGKTRILQTINSLYELAKEKKKENFSKIIDSMNLDKLKINGVNYNSLFVANERFKKIGKENFERYLDENIGAFEKLLFLLNGIPLENHYRSVNRKSRANRILEYLNRLIQKSNRDVFYPDGFDMWINDLLLLVNSFRNNMHHSKDFYLENDSKIILNNIEEVLIIVPYLKDKYQILDMNLNDPDLTLRLEENSKKIMDNLSLKSARYITTDNIEIINIFKKIELEINAINSDMKAYFWSEECISNLNNEFSNFFQKRNNLMDKISKFNQIISKYADIKIDLINITELAFWKNNKDITFDKLSSGERKITFLFLEILLNDVDIYLIDEPELSLSLNYQNKIITDLHVLTKGKTLFIATHAPYIYEDFLAIKGNISKEV